MIELIHAAFAVVNLPATVLLLVVALYWVIFLFGLIDFEAFDLDIGKEVHVETDVSVDVDADVDAGGAEADADAGEPGGIKGILYFLNVGTMPFMVWLSFFALTFWVGSLLTHHYLAGMGLVIGFALLIPLFLGSAFVTKFTTLPFRQLFAKMDMEAKPLDLLGKLCTVTLSATPGQIGQADIWIDESYIRVNVQTEDGHSIAKGEQAIIYAHQNDENIYLVEPFTHA